MSLDHVLPTADMPGAADFVERRLRATFERVAPFTLGVEEELVVVDAETLEPTPVDLGALDGAAGEVKRELRTCQVELATPICITVADAVRELRAARRRVGDHLGPRVGLLGAGTHPFALEPGPVSGGLRYAEIAFDHPWAARHVLTCGLHVHVAVGGADRTLAVYNALRSFLPEILALAANAPFYRGEDSGLATVRPKLNQFWPRAGVPPAFGSWRELSDFVVWSGRGGAVPDPSYQWWDLRLAPAHGTVEVRVADAQTRVEDVGPVAALVHSLVVELTQRYDAGEVLPVHREERIVENMWLATRDGVGGHLVDLERGYRVPTSERLAELAVQLLPTADSLGCGSELVELGSLVAEGGGAGRQRRLVANHGREALGAVLAGETGAGAIRNAPELDFAPWAAGIR